MTEDKSFNQYSEVYAIVQTVSPTDEPCPGPNSAAVHPPPLPPVVPVGDVM